MIAQAEDVERGRLFVGPAAWRLHAEPKLRRRSRNFFIELVKKLREI
jgi:hypothetical protein